MILWLLFLVVSLWTVLFRYRRRHMYKLAASIPGSKDELPVIGVAHALIGTTEDILTTLQRYSYEANGQGGVLKGWLAHILYTLATDPVDLGKVLKTCMEKDDLHRFIRNIIGFGAIFAPVPIWRRRRKIMVPAFSPKILDSFVEVFSEQSQKLTKHLDSRVSKGPFKIWPYISAYTLDSVCETAMGVQVNAQGNPGNKFLMSMNRILNLITARIFHLWLQPDWLYKFTPTFNEHEKCVNEMHSFADNVIENKRKQIKSEEKKSEGDNGINLSSHTRKSFLDLIISFSGGDKGYTNIELREESLMLIVAGTDTSAVAIGYTLKLLAKYPEIQERAFQEIFDIFGDSDRPLVKDDLPRLKYLERVIKESMRLFPPVPFIIRKVQEDTSLACGVVMPAGSGVVCSIWGAHRDPQYWGPDAEHFDPDRFLPERFNLEHPCSYMPFSSGPRNCLGYQYALMSIKTVLSTMLRKYRVVGTPEPTPIPHIRSKLDVMLKAVDGYEVALERRTRFKHTAQG